MAAAFSAEAPPPRVVINSTINGNSADGNGGGFFGSSLTLIGSTISSNSAKLAGGGISA